MVNVRQAEEILSQRDPLFFAKRQNFWHQKEKPMECESCSLYHAPYALEEPPQLDRRTGEVIPPDVLIIIPRPTMADVGEPSAWSFNPVDGNGKELPKNSDEYQRLLKEERERLRQTYQQGFGSPNWNEGSRSWRVYRKVIDTLRKQHTVTVKTVYATPCRGKGQTPVSVARYCGEQYLRRKVAIYKPKAILCLGMLSAKALGFTPSKMVSLRGTIDTYESLQHTCPIVFTYDPDLYFFPTKEYAVIQRFECDFAKAVDCLRGNYHPVNHDEFREKLEYPTDDHSIRSLIRRLFNLHDKKKLTLAFDLETTGLWHWYDDKHCEKLNRLSGVDPEKHPEKLARPAEIVAISLAWGETEAAAFLTLDLEQKTWDEIRRLLESDIPKVAHNAKFDMSYLLGRKGIRVKNLHADTLLNQHAIDENRTGYVHGEYSLKKLVWDYLPEFGGYEQLGDVSEILKAGMGAQAISDVDAMLYYAALDSLVTWRLFKKQFYLLNDYPADSNVPARKIPLKKRYTFTRKFITEAAYVISEMEVGGLRLDLDELSVMQKQVQKLLNKEDANARNALMLIGKQDVNYRSTKQLEELLFDTLKLPVLKKTKTGRRSTDESTLQELVEKDRTGLVEALTKIRRLEKLKKSFLDNWETAAKGDRLYPFINLDGTKTGRLSMREPNIQQVPKSDKFMDIARAYKLPDDFFDLKRLFIADEDYLLIDADFSQMEVRVLAAYCEQGSLVEALKQGAGLDVHSAVASLISGEDYDLIDEARKDKTHPRHEELKKLRDKTKNVTFAITYGGSSYTLKSRYGVPESEGKELFEEFFRRFPEVKAYIEKTHKRANRLHYVDTKFHRRRHFPILEYTSHQKALRQAQNSRIQSTASDICLNAVIDLQKKLKTIGGRVLITVHDSIVSQVPKDRIKEGLQLYKEAMIHDPMDNWDWLCVPLAISLEVGKSWGNTIKVPLDETTWDEKLGHLLAS